VMPKRTVLVVEDDPEVRNYLEMALRCQGYQVETAEDGEEALARLDNGGGQRISVVLLDILMPRKEGLEVLREIRVSRPNLPVIMLSGLSSPLKVVEAMKSGASDFLAKPVSHEDLDQAIRKALQAALGEEQGACAAGEPEPATFPGTATPHSEAMLDRVAASDVPVLLQGETGVGKEMLARKLHARSPRARKPFLKVNCAALPSELVESELFGYERGAFTGAFRNKPGKFEMADGGTIMLDEIGDMDLKLQAKLLHVLQDQEFERLGGREPVRVDVRVMAATHCDLEAAVREGRFRADLYYRLNVICLRVPPLRERREEIIPLAEFLLAKHTPPASRPPALPPVLKRALLAYDWPGNVRELENVMRRYLVLQDAEGLARELGRRNLASAPSSAGPIVAPAQAGARRDSVLEAVNQAKLEAERQAILDALNATRWNRKRAAQLLRIDYKALLYKMKKLALAEEAPAESACRERYLTAAQGA
jgi:two-component system response regulator AtoC